MVDRLASGSSRGREHRGAGEIGHPQLTSRGVVERDEDVELADGDPVRVVERLVEPRNTGPIPGVGDAMPRVGPVRYLVGAT